MQPSEVLRQGARTRVYDDIVLASGAGAFVPPVSGMPEKGVFVMRTAEDADALIEAAQKGASSALVVGASWVGIKVVEALRAHGVSSALADMAPYIFPTACLPKTAEYIQNRLQRMGIVLKFNSGIKSMAEDGQRNMFNIYRWKQDHNEYCFFVYGSKAIDRISGQK